MTRLEAVQPEGGAHALLDELVPYVVFGKAFVDTEVHDPRGEALVEPKVSPPLLLITVGERFIILIKLITMSIEFTC